MICEVGILVGDIGVFCGRGVLVGTGVAVGVSVAGMGIWVGIDVGVLVGVLVGITVEVGRDGVSVNVEVGELTIGIDCVEIAATEVIVAGGFGVGGVIPPT